MRVALFNVKYSQNLGDGLLTDCLEQELRSHGVQTISYDLAGRDNYESGIKNRRALLRILSLCPSAVRRTVVRSALTPTLERRLRPKWRNALAGVDAVILGGGHLLSDQDLNFPLKVAAALGEAAAARLPTAVFGVGVSDDWTGAGKKLFRQALADASLIYAAVRDERSQQAWVRQAASLKIDKPRICVDPGVLAARHFPPLRRSDGPPLVALGLTDPLALRYHASSTLLTERSYGRWLIDLVREFATRGWRTALFTNGSQEDRVFLAKVAPLLVGVSPSSVTVADAFPRPAEMAGFISVADIVVAHRLHACIAGYAYGRPTVGFAWDQKVDAFFELTGRASYMARPVVQSPAIVAGLAARAMQEGLHQDTRHRIVERCRDDISRLNVSLRAAVFAPADSAATGGG